MSNFTQCVLRQQNSFIDGIKGNIVGQQTKCFMVSKKVMWNQQRFSCSPKLWSFYQANKSQSKFSIWQGNMEVEPLMRSIREILHSSRYEDGDWLATKCEREDIDFRSLIRTFVIYMNWIRWCSLVSYAQNGWTFYGKNHSFKKYLMVVVHAKSHQEIIY